MKIKDIKKYNKYVESREVLKRQYFKCPDCQRLMDQAIKEAPNLEHVQAIHQGFNFTNCGKVNCRVSQVKLKNLTKKIERLKNYVN